MNISKEQIYWFSREGEGGREGESEGGREGESERWGVGGRHFVSVAKFSVIRVYKSN